MCRPTSTFQVGCQAGHPSHLQFQYWSKATCRKLGGGVGPTLRRHYGLRVAEARNGRAVPAKLPGQEGCVSLASPAFPLGQIMYSTFSGGVQSVTCCAVQPVAAVEGGQWLVSLILVRPSAIAQDYDAYYDSYHYLEMPEWFITDFTKYGLPGASKRVVCG